MDGTQSKRRHHVPLHPARRLDLIQINNGLRTIAYAHPRSGVHVQREAQPLEDELLDLAAASRRVARGIDDPVICSRLMEIAEELTEMAGHGTSPAG